MSKIICDICGTVYPDNATACPICGYPRQDSEKAVLDESEVQASSARTSGAYVKGGRFSSKNVKKRHKDEGVTEQPIHRTKKPDPSRKANPVRKSEPARKMESTEMPDVPVWPKRAKAGNALKVTVAVLAVAVIAVGGYIGWRFYKGADAYKRPSTAQTTSPATAPKETQQATTAPIAEIACVGLSVSDETITFEGPGRAWLLSVVPVPEDTTQNVVYTSSDEKVATVTEQGRVTSVGPGEAVITITCGDSVRECKVICDFDGTAVATEENNQTTETSKPTKPTEETQSTHYKDDNWVMSNEYGDATLIIGEEFRLELNNDAGETANVTWTADADGVVSIEGNVIKGESVGMVDVSTTINGKTFTCIVRVIQNRD